MHSAVKIHRRAEYSFLVEFNCGNKRWVDITQLVLHNPKYKVYSGHAWMLDEVYLINGSLQFASAAVQLSGPSAYHMGSPPVPIEPEFLSSERVWGQQSEAINE